MTSRHSFLKQRSTVLRAAERLPPGDRASVLVINLLNASLTEVAEREKILRRSLDKVTRHLK